ncbi:MAG: hypothetical protein GF313_03790 [Caldithrix sp.]|nr:hypothetical protein [Caldithrix sp.]
MKKSFLILFIFLIFFVFLSCDGRLRVKGYTYNNSLINGVVSDSLFVISEKGIPINDAKIMIYNFLNNDLSIKNLNPTVILSTDSAGYFEWETIIPPMQEFSGALVTQKNGYRNDTLYFKYKSSIKPYKFIVNLKQY